MPRILGIDPGLADTGWGVIETKGNKAVKINHGTIQSSAGDQPGRRLLSIYEALSEVIEQYKSESAGVEDIFFAKNRKTAIPVAQARGVILLCLEAKGVMTYSYTPLQIKQALTGNGRAEKHQVEQMVKLVLGLIEAPKPDHASDALAAALCCFHNLPFQKRPLTR